MVLRISAILESIEYVQWKVSLFENTQSKKDKYIIYGIVDRISDILIFYLHPASFCWYTFKHNHHSQVEVIRIDIASTLKVGWMYQSSLVHQPGTWQTAKANPQKKDLKSFEIYGICTLTVVEVFKVWLTSTKCNSSLDG